jgi:hypothetical protein
LATSNGGSTFTVVKQFVHDDGTTKTQKSKLDTANLEQHGTSLVNYVKVGHLVLGRAELFQYPDVFASTPDGIYGDLELHLSAEQKWELREGEIAFLTGSGIRGEYWATCLRVFSAMRSSDVSS